MTGEPGAGVTGRSAAAIAERVRSGAVSPVQVVEDHLARIAALDPRLHAFQLVRAERALAEAAAVAERPDLAELPLAGVPVAIKDNIDLAGEPTRLGSGATPDTPAPADDELVRRLRAAGAVVVGKTTMPELAIWPFTEPEAFAPPARNPWDPTRTPGGSTGGGAAAVATGMVPLALGSDGGGSLRIPAACCGLVALKPGPGLVPLARGRRHWYGLTEYGPLAHGVADLALMLDVLAGRAARPAPEPPSRRLRVAVSTRPPMVGARVSPEVARAVERTASLLGDAGHEVRSADPPYPLDLGPRYTGRWLAGIAEDARELPRDRLERRTRGMVRAGHWLTRAGLARPAEVDGFRARVTAWFGAYDVLLTATVAEPAVPIGRWHGRGWLTTTLGSANWIFTPPWNLAGFPAASAPAGRSAEGLPLAVQLVAPPGGEDTLLALLAQLEQLQPWPRWQEPSPMPRVEEKAPAAGGSA